MTHSPVPETRLRLLNGQPVHPRREWVLYWMLAARRPAWNFGLDRAVEYAQALGRPLVVLEALRAGYPNASDRLHAFVLQGMAVQERAFAGGPARYYPYVEREPGEGRGLLEALAARACVVVTDDWPGFFVPRLLAATAPRLDVRLEAVDGNGLWPTRATQRVFTTAHSFRAHLQKALPPHLGHWPRPRPFEGVTLPSPPELPGAILKRWPRATPALLAAEPRALAALPIDHAVKPVELPGGHVAATERLTRFLEHGLSGWSETHHHPDDDGTSRLSPYLHFGHVGTHQVFAALARREGWTRAKLGRSRGGAREGWWNLSPSAEAFVDQVVTWRELAFNLATFRPSATADFEEVPAWARATLARHEADAREHTYSLEQLEQARTHDALWNAAQRQLTREGWCHGYLRMLWGKRILEWSPTAREALGRMEGLMNRYALDGRDPVSTASYLWVLGKYDRPWGPERPVFGSVRYLSSANTARKLRVREYVKRWA